MLVGTKCDLKENQKALEEMRKLSGPEAQPITKEEGDALAKQIKAYAYFETSAKENIGVTEALNAIFEAAEKVDEMKPTCICLWAGRSLKEHDDMTRDKMWFKFAKRFCSINTYFQV